MGEAARSHGKASPGAFLAWAGDVYLAMQRAYFDAAQQHDDALKALEYNALLMEALLAELRYIRGMSETESDFLNSGDAGSALRLDEFQKMRQKIFTAS